jgi:hypothetical protein
MIWSLGGNLCVKDVRGAGLYTLKVFGMAWTTSGNKTYRFTRGARGQVLWNVTSCRLLHSNRRFERAYSLHICLFVLARQPPVGQRLLIHEVSR